MAKHLEAVQRRSAGLYQRRRTGRDDLHESLQGVHSDAASHLLASKDTSAAKLEAVNKTARLELHKSLQRANLIFARFGISTTMYDLIELSYIIYNQSLSFSPRELGAVLWLQEAALFDDFSREQMSLLIASLREIADGLNTYFSTIGMAKTQPTGIADLKLDSVMTQPIGTLRTEDLKDLVTTNSSEFPAAVIDRLKMLHSALVFFERSFPPVLEGHGIRFAVRFAFNKLVGPTVEAGTDLDLEILVQYDGEPAFNSLYSAPIAADVFSTKNNVEYFESLSHQIFSAIYSYCITHRIPIPRKIEPSAPTTSVHPS